jgi:hypothetical protein
MTEIRLATRADLPSVARLFGGAFIDDAMLRWPLPPEATAEDLTELFAILLDVYWPLDAISVIGDEGRPSGSRRTRQRASPRSKDPPGS